MLNLDFNARPNSSGLDTHTEHFLGVRPENRRLCRHVFNLFVSYAALLLMLVWFFVAILNITIWNLKLYLRPNSSGWRAPTKLHRVHFHPLLTKSWLLCKCVPHGTGLCLRRSIWEKSLVLQMYCNYCIARVRTALVKFVHKKP